MKRWFIITVECLIGSEILLAFLSWLFSSLTTGDVRSLLSSEGIRWFMGQYVYIIQSPLLVCLLLLSISWGIIVRSNICKPSDTTQSRLGRRLAIVTALGFLVFLLSLTIVPHAILLSSTGIFFPSPFGQALVPFLAFAAMIISIVYGIVVRSFQSPDDIVQASLVGIKIMSPVFLLYILAAQLFESIRFVFFVNVN